LPGERYIAERQPTKEEEEEASVLLSDSQKSQLNHLTLIGASYLFASSFSNYVFCQRTIGWKTRLFFKATGLSSID
jgi:hypothetical protein